MKSTYIKLSVAAILLLGIYSCKKGEATVSEPEASAISDSATVVSDSISSVATSRVKDKQFVKTAEVKMEVKDVYDATIAIEKSVQELGGFVTRSNMQSNIISEETYNTSDENAVLVKKYQSENTIQVRVPTQKLGEFLSSVNDKKLFLNSRLINAEDVTSNIKYAELEGQRIKKTEKNIAELKANKDKVKLDNENMEDNNLQQLANMDVADNVKYSTVDVFLKEPKLRVAEIAVTNSGTIDNKYKMNFFYNAKSAFSQGFYLIQKFVLSIIVIWPFLIIFSFGFYFYLKFISKNKRKKIATVK